MISAPRRLRGYTTALATMMIVLPLLSACGQESGNAEDQPTTAAHVDAATEMPPALAAGDGEDAASESEQPEPHSVLAYDPAGDGGVLILAIAEPDTLYRYGGNMIAAFEIINALGEWPVVTLDYDYQAVAVKQVPRLEVEGSGARLEQVAVEPGERFVHPDTQEVVTATETVPDLQQLAVQYTFRDGLTWEDGTPVTADDSVFASHLSCHPDTPTSKDLCDKTAHYTAIDDRTVEWRGLPGFADQDYHTNVYRPLPRHQVGSGGSRMDAMAPGEVLEDEVFTRSPLSYGPFKMVEWVAGDHVTVERNPLYWRADEGLPFVDQVVFSFMPDPNSVFAALSSGDVDVAKQSVDQLDALEAAEQDGTLRTLISPANTSVVVAFNTSPADDRVPIAACRAVRSAVTLAHDRDTAVYEIGRGELDVLHSIVPPDHWASPPESDLTTYDYDPEAAAEMLEDLGFKDEDGDGVREAVRDIACPATTNIDGATEDRIVPSGSRLELTLNLLGGDPLIEQWGLLFQQNMADVGIGVELEFLPGQVLLAKGPDGPVMGRRYDLAAFAWRGGVQPSAWLYFCDQIPTAENGWSGLNVTGWCDPEYQRLGMAAAGTIDRAEALAAYHEAQQIYSEELPAMPFSTWPSIVAVSPDVVNVRPNPSVSTLTWNIGTWGFAE